MKIKKNVIAISCFMFIGFTGLIHANDREQLNRCVVVAKAKNSNKIFIKVV